MLIRILLAVRNPEQEARILAVIPKEQVLLDVVRGRRSMWRKLSKDSCDVVLIGRNLLYDSPAKTIATIRALPDEPLVAAIWEDATPEDRAALDAAGCETILNPQFSDKILSDLIGSILDKRKEQLNRALSIRSEDTPSLNDFASRSTIMQTFMATVRKVASSSSSLLISGETGVGKERLARAIHAESGRHGPFIAINTGALPDTLLESELFGHEEGAFTGAIRSRRGAFELAHEGTIFLDEIGEMPLRLQVKLLRVLQEREIQRLGSERVLPVDVRIMAATNRDLLKAVEDGEFRKDLYYRLGVVSLSIPPLKERSEDIPGLVETYLQHFRLRIGKQVNGIDPRALQAMLLYHWPGNVRELVNVVERALLLSTGTEIGLEDLPESISHLQRADTLAPYLRSSPHFERESIAQADTFPEAWRDKSLKEVRELVLDCTERIYLSELLRQTGGRIGDTARRAGIDVRSVFEKMRRLGLKKEDFKHD